MKVFTDALMISKLILYLINKKYKRNIGPLKLQKILWYSYIYYWHNYKKELFDENFMAWVYGPVVFEVWKAFKIQIYNFKFKNVDSLLKIHENEIKFFENIEKNKDKSVEFLNYNEIKKSIVYVLSKKINTDSLVLTEETHKQKPWIDTRNGIKNNEPSNEIIDKELIKKNSNTIINEYLI